MAHFWSPLWMWLCQGLILDTLTLLTSNWPAQGDYFQSTWGSSSLVLQADKFPWQNYFYKCQRSVPCPLCCIQPTLNFGKVCTQSKVINLHLWYADWWEMEEKNITSYLIPGLSLTVIALAFVQQRLTRCSSCKRASIFQRIIFSVLEGRGELHSSAVLWRGQVPPASWTSVNILSNSDRSSTLNSQQDTDSGADGLVRLQVTGGLQITS